MFGEAFASPAHTTELPRGKGKKKEKPGAQRRTNFDFHFYF